MTKFSTIILGVDRFLLLPMAFEGRHYWVNHLMTYLKKNSQEHNVKKKVSSFTLAAVVMGLSVARKRKKLKWITDFEVTKCSTIILGVDWFLLLLMVFEGGHYWVNHLMAVAYIFVWSVNTIAGKNNIPRMSLSIRVSK